MGEPSSNGGGGEGGGGLDRRSALRGLGTAAAAAVGLVAANGALRPSAAAAADGDPLTIGTWNVGSTWTWLETSRASLGDGAPALGVHNGGSPASGEISVGVHGRAPNTTRSVGVLGDSTEGTGVRGVSQAGPAVHGEASSDGAVAMRGAAVGYGGIGVLGEASGNTTVSGTGVHGVATGIGGTGVLGGATGDSTTPGVGVQGESDSPVGGGAAVRGINTNGGYGVEGRSREPGGVGVYAEGGHSVLGYVGTGLYARADFGTPLRLGGAAIEVPPSSGTWTAGAFLFKDGALWLCEATGSPGTWRRLYSSGFSNFLEFITPTRVFNTLSGGRNHPGVQGEPLVGDPDSPYTIDISGELPARATAMYASVTAVPVDENGWISAWESGPWPVTANLTWRQGENITNLSLVGLTGGHTFELTLQENRSSHVVVDVLAIVVNE